MHKLYIHPLPVRLWHWINAIGFVLLIITGGIFVIEALSVALQVAAFKAFRRRVLLMAPVHHHFELAGMDELYDLQADPYELDNLIGTAQERELLPMLQAELERLLRDADPAKPGG